ncbi:ABC transporter permease [Enterococcus sp. AZ072]|uniref:ABC transporter permease n=1 Tax=unclassified Enterococcus TaxID=2608891 RepID=UPI003D2B9240
MRTLIKLEFRKTNFHTYFISTLLVTVTMLVFLYLFAYAPLLEPKDEDMLIFSGYRNLIPLFEVLNMAVYGVLAAVMYSKLIIEEYSGKKTILLFSYPLSRKKIILSKICVVSIFTILSMLVSNLIIFGLFGISEQFVNLVNEKFTISLMLQTVQKICVMSFTAASIGVISVGIGFIKKSVPATIISAVLIASLLCNVMVNTTTSMIIMYLFAVIILIVGILSTLILMRAVVKMEVE